MYLYIVTLMAFQKSQKVYMKRKLPISKCGSGSFSAYLDFACIQIQAMCGSYSKRQSNKLPEFAKANSSQNTKAKQILIQKPHKLGIIRFVKKWTPELQGFAFSLEPLSYNLTVNTVCGAQTLCQEGHLVLSAHGFWPWNRISRRCTWLQQPIQLRSQVRKQCAAPFWLAKWSVNRFSLNK